MAVEVVGPDLEVVGSEVEHLMDPGVFLRGQMNKAVVRQHHPSFEQGGVLSEGRQEDGDDRSWSGGTGAAIGRDGGRATITPFTTAMRDNHIRRVCAHVAIGAMGADERELARAHGDEGGTFVSPHASSAAERLGAWRLAGVLFLACPTGAGASA
ncbi:hypothetical protein CYMTET_12913 [Cymbomonas tetramitiformis]|uniref:Uncharacterized protein n=1 Tax=Cymbomonas tetramitiformis TaxID=36881 RepID=A0AAE0GJ52_9CHLO|nr:hypothetical protein CYMTET_12913 [Cymbomonas tetramitiformis]